LVEEATEEGASLVDTAASHGGAVAGAAAGVAVAVEAAAAEDEPAAVDADWEAGHGVIEAGVLAAGDEAMQLI
jgi:hypothetical protein